MSEEAIRKVETRLCGVKLDVTELQLHCLVSVLHRKPDVPPNSLVLRILQPKQFKSVAIE